MFFWDPTFVILIPGLLLAFWAQAKVQSTFRQYLHVRSRKGYTGAQVAQALLRANGVTDVTVERTRGMLTDHYDPRTKVIRLSDQVYDGTSLASIGVAAHETGHALQHHQEYFPLQIRNSLVPVANFGSNLAFPLFFIGFFFQSQFGLTLMNLGILLFSAALLFQLVTLPVELNASNRAIAMLTGQGIISMEEESGARKVLSAAAWTYVAAVAMAALQLIRLLVLRGYREE
ncbi:MAG: zinc metallopeptidase [Firmicutes bacterium]|nr:zinc metallopeptidase [Bacillota bacterium]